MLGTLPPLRLTSSYLGVREGCWALVSLGFLCEVHRFYLDTSQSAVLLWTRDRLHAENSKLQHTTLTRHRHPCPWGDSNPYSQQASGCRLMP